MTRDELRGRIQTVLGPIEPGQLGRTLMHEHLYIAFPGAEFDSGASFDRAAFVAEREPMRALAAYEAKRLPATSEVVLTNRRAPPDRILQEVFKRTGDKPFRHIDDVISPEELAAMSESYKRVAGYDKEKLKVR